jgi:hypothetical protein
MDDCYIEGWGHDLTMTTREVCTIHRAELVFTNDTSVFITSPEDWCRRG